MHELWVFGYGSLMWRPGFAHVEAAPALLRGWHRALCVYSWVHRGTPERPGLVLGLDRGGACRGTAFRIAPDQAAAALDYLRAREQPTLAYREIVRPVRLLDGTERRVKALLYVADRRHEQYAGDLSFEETLRLVRQGRGLSGPNGDYVRNTAAHLDELGIHDPLLTRLAGALASGEGGGIERTGERRGAAAENIASPFKPPE